MDLELQPTASGAKKVQTSFLDFSKMLRMVQEDYQKWIKCLTIYHTILNSKTLAPLTFWKHCGKRREDAGK